jgi:lipopolysaccharide biosynthesis protein
MKNSAYEILAGTTMPAAPDQRTTARARPIAFYLPQFHRTSENSEWWGAGFTEWTNVAKARPNFDGHHQPQIPADLGFYDLAHLETMREQVNLAKEYGVYGFCFYYYWFSGRRILEKPIDAFQQSDIDFPYCLCWANENWTRTWDGDARSILLEQKYHEEDPENFIASLQHHLTDARYIKINGKPLILVYRAKAIPNHNDVFKRWREHAREIGVGDIHISVVDFYDVTTPEEFGADSLTEFPPHKFNLPGSSWMDKIVNLQADFKGFILDYRKAIQTSMLRMHSSYPIFRAAMPSWDNTARRQNTSSIFLGATPELFESWLRYIFAWTQEQAITADEPYVFINAWNEWAEGAHLEPDTHYGRAWLLALASSVKASEYSSSADQERSNTLSLLEQKYHTKPATPVSSMTPSPNLVYKISELARKIPGLHPMLKKIYFSLFKNI